MLRVRRPGGAGGDLLDKRGLDPAIVDSLGFGFAPPGRDALLSHLRSKGFSPQLAVKAGLVADRDGRLSDRFWNRLMIPICRESGLVVAFGGRAMEADQVPEVPEQPGDADLLEGPDALRPERDQEGDQPAGAGDVLVEGYFDFAQALQGGVTAGRRDLRHGADAAAGAAAAAVRREGRAQLRSRRGRPGRRGAARATCWCARASR